MQALLVVVVLGSTQWITVAANESLAVTDAGVGQPVLLVPAVLGSGFAFRQLTPRLNRAGFRTIVVEPLGVGGSSRPGAADYSLHAQADRLAAALDTLNVRGAYVVSHAAGSALAFRLALRRPDLVRGIVSMEGGVAESPTTQGFRRAMTLAPVIQLLGTGFVRGKVRAQLRESSADPAWVTDAVVEGYVADAARDLGAALRVYRAMGRAREPQALAPRLSEIRCPVWLLLGGAPHSSGPTAEEIALQVERLPAFLADTLPGVGHYPHEEAPGAVVDAVIRIHAALTYRDTRFASVEGR